MKITWYEYTGSQDARITVSDGVITNYIVSDDLDDEFSMCDIANDYAYGYDHNGNNDDYVVAEIVDLKDDETHFFAFDGHGNFEWDTDRQFVAY